MEKCKEYGKRRKTDREQLDRIKELYKKRKKRTANLEELQILSKMVEFYKQKANLEREEDIK